MEFSGVRAIRALARAGTHRLPHVAAGEGTAGPEYAFTVQSEKSSAVGVCVCATCCFGERVTVVRRRARSAVSHPPT